MEGEKFKQMINDDKILNRILGYLSVPEQKDFLLGSNSLAKQIRKSKPFRKLTKLLICEASFDNKVLESSLSCEWNTVSIELGKLPVEALESIKCLVQRADTLEFHLITGHNQEMTSIAVTHLMTEILAFAHALKSLKIDCALMEKELKSVLTDMRVQNRLRNVDNLTFFNPASPPNSYSHSRLEEFQVLANTAEYEPYKVLGTYGLWTRNFSHLLAIRMNLKSLHVGKITSTKEAHLEVLATLINNNAPTLENLTFSADMWAKGIGNCVFPLLNSLQFRAHQNDENTVRKFLMSQPELEYLDVGFTSGFPLSVLTLIQGKASSEKLRKLRLKCKCFIGSLDPINWMFLRRLSSLDEFSLRTARFIDNEKYQPALVSSTDFLSVITNLPKGIKRVVLNGLKCKNPMDRAHHNMLTNFHYLTELDFMHCPDAVDDALLQILFSKHRCIRVLKFSHCSNVTAFGLTGVKEDGSSSGVSLSNLSNLREFGMRSCPCIVFDNLIDILQFKHLRVLDVFTSKEFSAYSIVEVLKKNPSLERISLNISRETLIYITSLAASVSRRLSLITRLLDPNDWSVKVHHDEDSSDEDEGVEAVGTLTKTTEDIPVTSSKAALAKKIAARIEELNFDDDDCNEDFSRFDSEDEFDGCEFIPG